MFRKPSWKKLLNMDFHFPRIESFSEIILRYNLCVYS